jgi:hypothetical protein
MCSDGISLHNSQRFSQGITMQSDVISLHNSLHFSQGVYMQTISSCRLNHCVDKLALYRLYRLTCCRLFPQYLHTIDIQLQRLST